MALLFYNSSTKEYGDCVALKWDRKHPQQVWQRRVEQAKRECEKDRLSGADPSCNYISLLNKIPGAGGFSSMDSGTGEKAFGGNEDNKNACERLSLEELRRADGEANYDKPPR